MAKRILSIIIVLCISMGFYIKLPTYGASAKTVEELQSQVNALQKEEEKLKMHASNIQKQIENQRKLVTNLESQINLINNTIVALESQIKTLSNQIISLEQNITNKLNIFKGRIRAVYMSNKGSIIQSLLNNKTFSEQVVYSDSMERIAQRDNKLISDLIDQKKDLEAKKLSLEANRQNLDAQKASLNQKTKEIKDVEANLEQQKDKTKEEIQALVNEMQAANSEIIKLIQESGSIGGFVGGAYMYPVPGYTRVSSPFGWRVIQGIRDLHTGTDFPAPMGTPVVASNMGKVISVKTSSGGYKGGYGMHIIIDHGGGQHSLYAHMSAFSVSVGQFVARGERIGSVGSTGWSTGPHMHIEIRINGQAVDPMPYLRG